MCHRTYTGGWEGVLSPSQVRSLLSSNFENYWIKFRNLTSTTRNVSRWHDLQSGCYSFSSQIKTGASFTYYSEWLIVLVKLDWLGHYSLFYLMVVNIRNRLSYEQFGAFLANVKELNSHKQTREVIHLVSALFPLILFHHAFFGK